MNIDFTYPQIWVAVSFILFFIFFGKLAWKQLSKFLDNKILEIKNEINEAQKLHKDAKDLLVFEKIFSELEPRLKNLLIPPIPLQYTILSGKTQAVLSAEVNQYIRMGWQPIGPSWHKMSTNVDWRRCSTKSCIKRQS